MNADASRSVTFIAMTGLLDTYATRNESSRATVMAMLSRICSIKSSIR